MICHQISGDSKRLASRIANRLFKLGSEPGHPCKRIQFKSGPMCRETGNGGLNKRAFENLVYECLEIYSRKGGGK